jgi:murein L,D-transpeptidase YcbB/YkuD
VRELLTVIESSSEEGLRPTDYKLAALQHEVEAGTGPALDSLANQAAMLLAHDYFLGRVGDRSDMQWMIERSPYEASALPARLNEAITSGKIREFYANLLPSDPRYQALRTAFADATDGLVHDRLRANMERWRWMPRSLPADYLFVNVPSYRLQVFQGGLATASYDVVVGAKATPTPQLLSPTGSLVINPAWYVPTSIVRKSGLRSGRDGYVWRMADGERRLVQLPGPRNALGRIKLNLKNDQAIFLHDTNAKGLFARNDRALSHGCIRVKDIDQLAATLMSQGGDESGLEEALARRQTATLALPQTWPVYIVYFTADVDEAGAVDTYADPYGYDPKVLAALDGAPVEMASS